MEQNKIQDDELLSLIEKSIPSIPEIKFDAAEILKQSIRVEHKRLIIFSNSPIYLLIILFIGIVAIGIFNKVKTRGDITSYKYNKLFTEYSNNSEKQNINIYVLCDYSKHSKYNEWIEKYEFNDINNYDSDYNKYVSEYYKVLNNECYELIKNNFQSLNYLPNSVSEWMCFSYQNLNGFSSEYSSQSIDRFYQSKDYINLRNLSKEDYVERIVIEIY